MRLLKSTARGGSAIGEADCLRMFLDEENESVDLHLQGRIVAGLLWPVAGGGGGAGAREHLASAILSASTEGGGALEELVARFWSWGGAATDGFVSVLVDAELWSEKAREEKGYEKILQIYFKWFVWKMEHRADGEQVKSALGAISRILVTHAEFVQHLMNAITCEELLLAVSRGRGTEDELERELATQATLAAAKYITAAGRPGEALLAQFMTQRLVVSENNEDIVVAIEVAVALFPLIQQVATRLFTETEGFVGRLVDVLEEGERPGGGANIKQRSEAVRAVVRLLGVACGEKVCREVVRERCADHLERIVARGGGGKSENETRTLAALALAKIHSAGPGSAGPGTQPPRVVDKGSVDELARIFKTALILQSSTTTTSQQETVEGLAYTSLDSSVKQTLVSDWQFLTALLKTLSSPTASIQGVLYGGLTVLANIATYPPVLTEEQRKVLQLKSYAEANPSANTDGAVTDSLETDDAITARCKKLLDAGVVPTLVTIFKHISQTSTSTTGTVHNAAITTAGSALLLIPTILLSVSKTQKHRPQIAQQGGVKLLLQIYSAVTAKPATSTASSAVNTAAVVEVRHTTAHALARILVSVNPALVFSSQTPPASAIRPLLALLNTRYDDEGMPAQRGPSGATQTTDLLPTFEALLALTNLASIPSDGSGGGVQDLMVRVGWDQLEDVLLMHAPRSSTAISQRDDGDEDSAEEEEVRPPKKRTDTADASTRIQRAAVELICNLCGSYSPLALEKFTAPAPANPRVSGRLHLLLALADAEDYPTRRAAAGAIAVLTEFETVVKEILARERGVGILLGMLKDEEDEGEEMAMRGVVCVRNLVEVGGEGAVKRVKEEGGKEALVQAVKRARGKEVVELGVETVRLLL